MQGSGRLRWPVLPVSLRLKCESMTRLTPLPLFVVVILLFAQDAFGQAPAALFNAKVKPFLEAHCTACHGPDVQKAGLRVDTLEPDFRDAKTMSQWIRLHDKLV